MRRLAALVVVLGTLALAACASSGPDGDTSRRPRTTTIPLETIGVNRLAPATSAITAAPTTVRRSGDEYYDEVHRYLLGTGTPEDLARCIAMRATADHLSGIEASPQRNEEHLWMCSTPPTTTPTTPTTLSTPTTTPTPTTDDR